MNRLKLNISLVAGLLIWLGVAVNCFSQEIKAKASLDSVTMLIGNQTHLRLEVKQPKNVILDFPVFGDTLQKSIDVLGRTELDTTTIDADNILLKKSYLITSFDSGHYMIPPIRINIDQQSGGGYVETNPLALKVFTFNVDTTQAIFDIKGVEDVPYTFREMLPWLVGGVLLIGFVILFIWLFRRIKRKEPVFSLRREKPKLPAHVVALDELEKLKKEKLWQTDRIKEFYTRLTEILRVYIEDRFQIKAMEQTSDEILEDMKTADLEGDAVLENLRQILILADLVKFAKMNPLPDENDLSMMNAFFIVNQTKIVEVKPIEEIAKESEVTNDEKQK
ncbi:hypothetical protein ACE1ET_10110 [Saccharicrinis sp. FJH62]|uniref:hypothetical protein n=1 Tax=Saccharicrinis sp. FJH62 TaxID=3344657 RepID=UPI0035D43AD3